MIEPINENDISKYQKYFKLSPNYTAYELRKNFKKASKFYHPSVRKDGEHIFDTYVVSYEVLKFILRNKKKDISLSEIINNWNRDEKQKVEEKLIQYKKVSVSDFVEMIESKPVAFKLFRGFFSVLLFMIISLMALVLIAEVVLGDVHFLIILSIAGLITVMFSVLFKKR